MASTVTIDLRHVARGLKMPLRQVQAVVELLDEGNTVPFITRYRKDQSEGLDEEQIRQIQSRLAKMRLLAERKQTILRSIEAQGKLTDKLTKQILAAGTAKRLEDLYLPYKPKKQTLATLARSRGLEPLAHEILEADPACANLDGRAADFVSTDRQVPTAADALLGAGHVLAECFGERADVRQRLREILQRTGKIVSARIGGDQKDLTEKAQKADKPPEETTETPQATAKPEDQPVEESKADEQPPEGSAKADNPGNNPAETAEPVSQSDQQPVGGEQNEQNEQNNNQGPSAVEQQPEPSAGSPAESAGDQAAEPENDQPADAVTEKSADQPAEIDTEKPADKRDDQPAEAQAEPTSVQPSEPDTAAQAGQPASPTVKPRPKRAKQREKLSSKELKKKRAEEKKIKAFRDYFDYREEIKKIPPHRVLALNRGERARVLRVKVECDLEAMHEALEELLVPQDHPHAEYLRGCARDALSRLILPALEREVRRELTERAEAHAVDVFARNLRNLLLQPPVCDQRVLAVDPGFKSGCKLAALDQFGNLLEHGVIYLVGRPERRSQARRKVLDLTRRYELSLVVIGNGTGCREAEEFIAGLIEGELKDRGVAYVIVNEAGASVYSTSQVGREEFPNYDASLRGAISIGRRLQDPLSELVKIDAASIGVGLYQHDVKAKHLRASLDEVVESCVNYVGVDVNTASPALLRYVSGLNQLTARRVYEHRLGHGPFRNREQLKEVPGLGETTFVQAAGFLKVVVGDNPLDATWIHPESYEAATRVLATLGCSSADLAEKEAAAKLAERVAIVDLEEMARQLEAGLLTLKDILAQLARPGRDPREDLPAPVFKQGILKLEDLTPGMELTGTVLNVVDFGCFVDIGMHDSGLVHVSQLADQYVRDPHEVVAVGDIVRVWVMDVDKDRRRVSLTMIQPGSERSRRRRRGRKPDQAKAAAAPESPGHEKQVEGGRPRRPRPKPPPRSKQSRRHKTPPKPKHRPKSRPKPMPALTEGMKSGKEPMRTFGDLAQYFQEQSGGDDDSRPGDKRAAERDAQGNKGELPAGKDQPPTSDEQPQTTNQETEDT